MSLGSIAKHGEFVLTHLIRDQLNIVGHRIEHLMTSCKRVENASVPEIAKSEHRGKETSKKEDLVAGRRSDETWIPGRGMPTTTD